MSDLQETGALFANLAEDPVIRRDQLHVVLSFMTPEREVVQKRGAWMFGKFVRAFSKRLNALFDELQEHYPEKADMLRQSKLVDPCLFDPDRLHDEYWSFVDTNAQALEADYSAEHGTTQTSVYGLKVRGTAGSREEADAMVEQLRRRAPDGKAVDMYVADVGKWLAWDPHDKNLPTVQGHAALSELWTKLEENNRKREDEFSHLKVERQDHRRVGQTYDEITTAADADAGRRCESDRLRAEDDLRRASAAPDKPAEDKDKVNKEGAECPPKRPPTRTSGKSGRGTKKSTQCTSGPSAASPPE